MKVPPKRKGNTGGFNLKNPLNGSLNESPSEKEGKFLTVSNGGSARRRLNESPSEKEGKFMTRRGAGGARQASMKVPPKRKGNSATAFV